MIVIQRAKMGQPLSVTEGINLVNSIISGTRMKSELIEFKKTRKFYKKNTTKEKKEHIHRLGRSYWKIFLKRYQHRLNTCNVTKLDEI